MISSRAFRIQPLMSAHLVYRRQVTARQFASVPLTECRWYRWRPPYFGYPTLCHRIRFSPQRTSAPPESESYNRRHSPDANSKGSPSFLCSHLGPAGCTSGRTSEPEVLATSLAARRTSSWCVSVRNGRQMEACSQQTTK